LKDYINVNTVAFPTSMRLAFEQALRGLRRSALTMLVRSVMKRRAGIVYRKRLWAVQRGTR